MPTVRQHPLTRQDRFRLPGPTARFTQLLAAVPALAIAPRHRLAHATLILADEVAAVFEANDMPLPPW